MPENTIDDYFLNMISKTPDTPVGWEDVNGSTKLYFLSGILPLCILFLTEIIMVILERIKPNELD